MIVYKYPFEITDHFTLDLPEGATVLTAQMQRDVSCLWAAFEPTLPMQHCRRKFAVVGTGQDFPDAPGTKYVATIQEREFVWHVFEVR